MQFFRFRTLQTRIFAFFFALLLVTQVGSIFITSTLGHAIVTNLLGEDLQTAKRVFKRLFDQNVTALTQGVRVMAADYGLREALTTNDEDTIVSALDNHGERIGAHLMIFIGTNGAVFKSSETPALNPNHEWVDSLDETPAGDRPGALIQAIDGTLYQLVSTRVRTPLPIGTLIAGYRIDTAHARDIGTITSATVSFAHSVQDADWVLYASTQPPNMQQALDDALDQGRILAERSSTLSSGSSNYLSLRVSLPTLPGQLSSVILQKSLDEGLAPFLDLRDRLVMLSLIGLLLSGLASLAIARGITRPVESLAYAARKMAQGDYSQKPVVTCTNEIGELAKTFGQMGEEIASREARIRELAYTDPLTGLANRACFTERLAEALGSSGRSGSPLAVVMLDLDRFRYVNEALGHPIGDLLLREVATRLQNTLRKTDTVARLSGDEFAILLPTLKPEGARKVVNTLLLALEAPMDIEGQLVDVQGSFGIAYAPDHSEDPATLMRCADIAMYKSKQDNSGFVEYDTRHDTSTLDRLSLMSELREAIEQDQLVLYYQPKIDLTPSRTYAVEALVRWVHPKRGFVPPNLFIPFSEHTGYIKEITRWVLNEGVKQCATWQRAGLDVNISINISARDLMSNDLPTYFASLLNQHGCRPERICLEITESAVLDDPQRALENLKKLESTGCKMALDDYGTGYSSLSYLKRMPVGELKIDQSFIRNMVNDPNDTLIVRSTIELAHNLGLKVVAEGVENAAILNQLCLLGCDQAQGYLFSKPVSAADFETWIHTQTWRDQVQVACRA